MAPSFDNVDTLTINTIRLLAVDAVSKANSGHPGAPMGLAPVAHVLFNKFMTFNPKNPKFMNRDRFVLSNGHGCMLLYALLHLYGYDLSLDDLKNFRQLGSKTPGHPEAADTPGVEVTTGPLGQGICNAVGLAMGQAHYAASFNKPGYDLFTNYTYCIMGDGCVMEGVASEACSTAGHLQLGNLIVFYDDNHISIDGDTAQALTEDVIAKYEAYGWHTQWVKDGDHDLAGLAEAIEIAKTVKDKPSLIKVTTTIGFGSLLQGTHGVHGNALKADDVVHVKKLFGFNPEEFFAVAPEVYELCGKAASAGAAAEEEWNQLYAKYTAEFPELGAELQLRIENKLPEGWEKKLPVYTTSDPAIASRKLSETVLNAICDTVPALIGGSADLTGSNYTRWKTAVDYQPPSTGFGTYAGRYIRYGVREHGMGAIMNGLAAYGGMIPFGGTFLNFVSYAAGAVRLSALSEVRVIWVATHDSIGLGEDGPTHQPIETLAHFRATPNLMVWRPADGNETSAAYYMALTEKHTPSIMALSRQNLPQLEGSTIEKACKGGYVLKEVEGADLTLVSTGSEVYLSLEAVKILEGKGYKCRLVSMPDWHTFDKQPTEYQLSVFPDGHPIMSVEVMTTLGWSKYSHEQFGINRFGASGPYQKVYEKFGFTGEGIAEKGEAVISAYKGYSPRSPLHKAFTLLE
ncbi:Transketolase, thiamine diphosphate binding domain-containing protein [Lipomyces arxii]|uniref:Transketolase, thiamine diphosphate binding domain-containing protein n=1 Tax=Lipomyces arxii TaxID=56418 RepID=UPI0034CD9C60